MIFFGYRYHTTTIFSLNASHIEAVSIDSIPAISGVLKKITVNMLMNIEQWIL